MARVKATGINQKGIGPQAMTPEKRQTFLDSASPILLNNRTIEAIRELSFDMPQKDLNKDNKYTYDGLILDLIKVYRKKKGLGDLWPSD